MDNRSKSISPVRDNKRSTSPTRSSSPPKFPQGKSPILLPNNSNLSTSPKISNTISRSPPTQKILIPPPRSPKSITNASPKPITNVSPKPITNASPKSITNASPKSITNASPKSIINASPKSITNASPKSITNASPKSIKNSDNGDNGDNGDNNNIDNEKPELKEINNDIILREWQIEWYGKARNILLGNHFYIDTSPMRSGKTIIALKLAKDFDLELMVICPLTTKNYWKNSADRYGVKLFTDPVNYESLVRGTKNDIVKYYLERKANKTHVNFVATKAYKEALKKRNILLILDEEQMIKNDCLQHKACNALIEPIITGVSSSRFGILSGTLIDKPEQIINLFRTIGYIKASKLYVNNKTAKRIELDGTQELINVCKQINFAGTDKFLTKTMIPTSGIDKKIKEEIDNFCFGLYLEVIKPKVAGAMSAPTTAKGELHVRNGYFHIAPQKAKQLTNALEELKYSSGYKNKSKSRSEDEEGNGEEPKSKLSGNYMRSLVQIEKSKLLDMARVAKKILSSEPTNKVVITINYTGPETGNLEELLGYLKEYDPLIITGKTTANKRDVIIKSFNDDPTKRVLIANPKTISVGISLVGPGQRYMLISPSSKLMEIVQLSARIYGDQLQVDSYVYIFYGIVEGNLEANILQFMGTKKMGANKIDTSIKDILEKKSDVLGRMQEDEIRRNMKLPSDYQDEYEDEDEVFY